MQTLHVAGGRPPLPRPREAEVSHGEAFFPKVLADLARRANAEVRGIHVLRPRLLPESLQPQVPPLRIGPDIKSPGGVHGYARVIRGGVLLARDSFHVARDLVMQQDLILMRVPLVQQILLQQAFPLQDLISGKPGQVETLCREINLSQDVRNPLDIRHQLLSQVDDDHVRVRRLLLELAEEPPHATHRRRARRCDGDVPRLEEV
mmetsp:Transcript_9879/g.28085  ORF Transcript_9879/g.28085 Transcript_9879/m.28085 type:complete len:205 (+) Transcript_9879:622-1236(+)